MYKSDIELSEKNLLKFIKSEAVSDEKNYPEIAAAYWEGVSFTENQIFNKIKVDRIKIYHLKQLTKFNDKLLMKYNKIKQDFKSFLKKDCGESGYSDFSVNSLRIHLSKSLVRERKLVSLLEEIAEKIDTISIKDEQEMMWSHLMFVRFYARSAVKINIKSRFEFLDDAQKRFEFEELKKIKHENIALLAVFDDFYGEMNAPKERIDQRRCSSSKTRYTSSSIHNGNADGKNDCS